MPRKRIEQTEGFLQVALQDSNNNDIQIIYNPKEYINELISKGKLKEATEYFGEIQKLFENAHPVNPYYIYKPVPFGQKVVLDHVPINKQASEDFPLAYKGQFSIKMGSAKTLDELMNKAYVNQEEIDINIKFLETWIGKRKIDDEGTLIREAVKEAKWALIPNELPPPIKIKIVNEDNLCTIFDYIELSLGGIDEENNTLILNNAKQTSSKHLVTLTVTRNMLEQVTTLDQPVKANADINVSIKDEFQGNVMANYKFITFLISTLRNNKLSFVNLETEKELIIINNYKLKQEESIAKLEQELDIVKKLLRIENHFNVEFNIPNKMKYSEHEDIDILLSILESKSLNGTFDDLVLDIDSKEGLNNIIKCFENKQELVLSLKSNTGYLELFGQTISSIKVEQKFDNLVIEDIEKIKRKLADMEEGELVKVKLISGSKNILTKTYKYFQALNIDG
ncbi:hypothetical protein [Peribacillus frigoritolerans]|uniref:hypothetical protein n=1 Tax=Peribacillus frigoritolerans TaxID=450367 RepID=UPI0010709BC7|nr:hypothetical protein [Peribacillus frigoritolerans]TFH63504.1 hypothetical protein E4J71_07075 [Peribacillus frigoritolerans]